MTDDDDHGCCTEHVSEPRWNDPGLTSLRYRIGDQQQFFARMIANISRQIVPPDGDPVRSRRPLSALTTRSLDDTTIAMLDAWACVCDILTFYQERYFNEGFLPTATEPKSVLEIAKAIGYQPRPGVAASTRLAFMLDETSAAPKQVEIAVGTAVMSIPGPNEMPQTFETIENVEARPEWNVLIAATTKTQKIDHTVGHIYLKGIDTRLSVGDPLVLLGKFRMQDSGGQLTERWDLRFVTAVKVDAQRAWTRVTLDRKLGDPPRTYPALLQQHVFTFRERGSLFGFNAPDFRAMSESVKEAFGGLVQSNPKIYKTKWPSFDLGDDTTVKQYLAKNPPRGAIDLDREYPKIVDGSWICLHDRTETELYRVVHASQTSRADFTLTAKCTRVLLDGHEHLTRFRRRSTTVLLHSEELEISQSPWTTAIKGPDIELDRIVTPMSPGRTVMIRGVDDTTGKPAVELATIKSWSLSSNGTRSVIKLNSPLSRKYRRDSLQVLGNVAQATHGSTVKDEVLGSGDGTSSHQRLALRQKPLTWVPAATASGNKSTLRLRVGGIEWTHTEALLWHGPRDRVYELHVDADGTVFVQLGDGIHGARASAGLENVLATYRKGIGLAGEVDSDQLTLLQTRPLGVRGVTNPQSAVGAADPESAAEIRQNAPLTTLTLDRLVSLQDYGDFARAFAGIGKAVATQLWDGKRAFVHVTVASASGKVFTTSDPTFVALGESYRSYQDPTHVVMLAPHSEIRLAVSVRIVADPAYAKTTIEASVRNMLIEMFSFSRRGFSMPLSTAEVTNVLQGIAGIRAIVVDLLHRTNETAKLRVVIGAKRPAWTGASATKAELLLIDPERIHVGWME